jgi:hypothetical protein
MCASLCSCSRATLPDAGFNHGSQRSQLILAKGRIFSGGEKEA